MNNEELKTRVSAVNKMFLNDGWGYIEAEWFLEREKIIGLGKKAVEEGKTEAAAYAMAALSGFDRALRVPSKYKELLKEFIEEDQQKEKEHDDR